MQAAWYARNKMRYKLDAAYKCPLCSKHHSYTRNNVVARYLTRLRDCKEGFIRMSSPDKAAMLKKVIG